MNLHDGRSRLSFHAVTSQSASQEIRLDKASTGSNSLRAIAWISDSLGGRLILQHSAHIKLAYQPL